ncbi:MAG: hypothetical protein AAFO75_01530 [Pseudomonadota bacterium]
MILKTIGRILWLPIACLISGTVAAFVLITLGQERLVQILSASGEELADFAILARLFSEGIALAAGLTVLPALAFIIIAEVARIRSALYYILGGGIATLAIPVLARYGQTAEFAGPSPEVWQVFATAGFAGGFVYWLIAGRYT